MAGREREAKREKKNALASCNCQWYKYLNFVQICISLQPVDPRGLYSTVTSQPPTCFHLVAST